MVLAPFSHHRFAIPFAFIIDPYFTAIIGVGLAAAMLKRRERSPAIVALVILGCYVGFQGVLHFQAIKIGEGYVSAHELKDRLGETDVQVYAIPQPLSPFNWKIIVSHGDDYYMASVNLLRAQELKPPDPASGTLGILDMWRRIGSGYLPVSAASWVHYEKFGKTEFEKALAREAWRQEAFSRFRRFAVFPVLDQIEHAGNGVCVSFLDLRFTVPSLPPSLVFGLCRDSVGNTWQLDEKRGAFGID